MMSYNINMKHHEKVYSTIGGVTSFYDFLLSVTGYKKSVNYFISQLPFNNNDTIKVLDAGCGTGVYSLDILNKYKQAKVTAFDLNEKLVKHLKEKVLKNKLEDRVRLFTADIQGPLLEIENEKFNLIITAGVLEYVKQDEVVKNLSSFLISGGYFMNSSVRDTVWGRFVCKLYACKPYSKSQNISVFEQNGFSIEKIIKVSKTPSASFKEVHIFKKK